MKLPPQKNWIRQIARLAFFGSFFIPSFIIILVFRWYRDSPSSIIFAALVLAMAFVVAYVMLPPRMRRWEACMAFFFRWKCGHCGYDIRSTKTRCPECGQFPGDFPNAFDPRNRQLRHKHRGYVALRRLD